MICRLYKTFLLLISLVILFISCFFLQGCEVALLGWVCKFNSISLLFITLTSMLTSICLVASWDKSVSYLSLFVWLEIVLVGFFATDNLLVFYVLFEFSLIPMFFIIGIWGSEDRIYAAYKFFLYTVTGSIPFLFAVMYLYVHTDSMDIAFLVDHVSNFDYGVRVILWMCFFFAFAVKVPMFPFHTWLPDVHVQSPMSGSVMLAGILIKLGTYGMYKVLLPIFPDISMNFRTIVIIFSVIAILYMSLVAFAQEDIKKLIAYSSVAHMGFVTAGLFSGVKEGVDGAIFHMLSHGVISAAMFLSVGFLYERTHSRMSADYCGLAGVIPIFSCFFVLFSMSSLGLPGLSGFIGEFLTIVGLFKDFKIYSLFIALGVLLSSIYTLSLCRSIIWGNINKTELSDLSLCEIVAFCPLVVTTLIMGITPNLFLNLIDSSSGLDNFYIHFMK